MYERKCVALWTKRAKVYSSAPPTIEMVMAIWWAQASKAEPDLVMAMGWAHITKHTAKIFMSLVLRFRGYTCLVSHICCGCNITMVSVEGLGLGSHAILWWGGWSRAGGLSDLTVTCLNPGPRKPFPITKATGESGSTAWAYHGIIATQENV